MQYKTIRTKRGFKIVYNNTTAKSPKNFIPPSLTALENCNSYLPFSYHFNRHSRMNCSKTKYLRILVNKKTRAAFYLRHKKQLLIHPTKFLALIHSISKRYYRLPQLKNALRPIPFIDFAISLLQNPINCSSFADYAINSLQKLVEKYATKPNIPIFTPSSHQYFEIVRKKFVTAFPSSPFISPNYFFILMREISLYNKKNPDKPKKIHLILDDIITNGYKIRNPLSFLLSYIHNPDKTLYPKTTRRKFLFALQHNKFCPTVEIKKQVLDEEKKQKELHHRVLSTYVEISKQRQQKIKKEKKKQQQIGNVNLECQQLIQQLHQKFCCFNENKNYYLPQSPNKFININEPIRNKINNITMDKTNNKLLSQLHSAMQIAKTNNQDVNLAAITFIKKMLKTPTYST